MADICRKAGISQATYLKPENSTLGRPTKWYRSRPKQTLHLTGGTSGLRSQPLYSERWEGELTSAIEIMLPQLMRAQAQRRFSTRPTSSFGRRPYRNSAQCFTSLLRSFSNFSRYLKNSLLVFLENIRAL